MPPRHVSSRTGSWGPVQGSVHPLLNTTRDRVSSTEERGGGGFDPPFLGLGKTQGGSAPIASWVGRSWGGEGEAGRGGRALVRKSATALRAWHRRMPCSSHPKHCRRQPHSGSTHNAGGANDRRVNDGGGGGGGQTKMQRRFRGCAGNGAIQG